MFTDSLGNRYSKVPGAPKTGHSAKPSKGGKRKIGRSKRAGQWRSLVKFREAAHRAKGHRFTSYPC